MRRAARTRAALTVAVALVLVPSLANAAPATARGAAPGAEAGAAAAAAAAPAPGVRLPLRTADQRAYASGHVLVSFRPGTTSASRARALGRLTAAARSTASVGATAVPGTRGVLTVPVGGDEAAAVAALRSDPAVAAASLDFVRHAVAVTPVTPKDTYYSSERYLYNQLRVSYAWTVTRGAASQVVAVVDSGVDLGHPDLAGKLVAGHDFVDGDAVAQDLDGHGTMVAGMIGADTNNATGIAGVNWLTRIMPVRVLDANGNGTDADVIAGIDWAADHGARLVNLSLGGTGDDPLLHAAVQYAANKGVLVVAAAGNNGLAQAFYPAAYPEALAVGATSFFSNRGPWVDLVAPGWDIWGTYPVGLTDPGYAPYAYGAGTSFAAPLVTGIASLLEAAHPTWTAAQVVTRLEGSARDVGVPGIDTYAGYGEVDAAAALGVLERQPGSVSTELLDDDTPHVGACPTSCTTNPTYDDIDFPGDADWAELHLAATAKLSVTMAFDPAAYTPALGETIRPQLAVYDTNLRLVASGTAANMTPLTVTATVPGGQVYVRATSADSSEHAQYLLTYSSVAPTGGLSPEGGSLWETALVPPSVTRNVAATVVPSVTYAPALDAASVGTGTVRLLDGVDDSPVAGAVAYDAVAHTVSFTPAAPLVPGRAYRFHVEGVTASGVAAPVLDHSFAVQDTFAAPGGVTGLQASGAGGLGTATLTWTNPGDADLAGVRVYYAVGTTPPSAATGTLAYDGFDDHATVSGLSPAKDYAFTVIPVDLTAQRGPSATAAVTGSAVLLTLSPTALVYGQVATATATLRDATTLAPVVGRSAAIYWRRSGTTTWSAIKVATSDAAGQVAVAVKPPWNAQLYAVDLGGVGRLRSETTLSLPVRFSVTEHLSATKALAGIAVTLSGSVAPARPAKPVLLEGYWTGTWHLMQTATLSATSAYTMKVRLANRGTFTLRVYKAYDTVLGTGLSPTFTLTVV